MATIKFSQLPTIGNLSASSIVPVVDGGINYQISAANLQNFVNHSTDGFTGNTVSITGNITGGNVSAVGTITGNNVSIAANIAGGNVSAVGNITGSYILGNGSQLTGLPASYGNANVVTLLANLGTNTISSTANVTTTANISGGYILGNGSQLSGLPATYSNANVTGLMANFGSNTISSTGNITTTANIAGNYILGNGSQLTGIVTTSYGDSNVTTLLAALGSNTISSTGNITTTANIAGNYFIGNGSQLSGINANYGNANVALFLANYGSNTISTTGNITGGNLFGNGAGITGITVAGGTAIVNGTSNVKIATANSNISVNVANTGTSGNYFVVNCNTNFLDPLGLRVTFGTIGAAGSPVIIGGAINGAGGIITPIIQSSNKTAYGASISPYFQFPRYTITQARAFTGGPSGAVISISDATPKNRLAFYDETNTRWSYVSDNTAV